ncbi:hypothetical protein Leryth_013618 [Lithospermum erythrorhizon]|nr:hypothetical protein Leryth_013618 [Lithospermum erythrorhizon]
MENKAEMCVMKDPKIKLFGKTIVMEGVDDDGCEEDIAAKDSTFANALADEDDKVGDEQDLKKELLVEKQSDMKVRDGTQSLMSEESWEANVAASENDSSAAASADIDAAPAKDSKTEEAHGDSNKTLKKPDKILPCPRCNSMDTKFCYFNNYNLNQPRHFCKNCQRYWTAGGTMRNVPVGAGRRKNKNSTNQFGHMTVPEALQNIHSNLPNSIHHPNLNQNGTVLTFGSDAPLCESMASVLNIAENSKPIGVHKPEDPESSGIYKRGEQRDDQSSGSTLTAGSSNNKVCKPVLPETAVPNYPNFPPQVACFPGGPWPYPWNSVQWGPVAPPGFCPPGYPMPFYPAAPYWSYNVPGTWSVPWISPPSGTHTSTPPAPAPNSPTLGKHSREENKTTNFNEDGPKEDANAEKCLWVPKTLRIDDPDEAARSSIWATLGIKNDSANSIGGSGLFKAFQSKNKEKPPSSEASTVLQANPAALSRSLNFNESS